MSAIVSYEPGFDFPFPEGEVPQSMTLGGRALSAITVPQSDFMLLTKIPIVIYYGDNIPEKPSVNPGQEQWRIFFEMTTRWRDVVNRHGGDVTVVHLPEIGIRGNTHFPMSDLNDAEMISCRSSSQKRSWTNPLLKYRGVSARNLSADVMAALYCLRSGSSRMLRSGGQSIRMVAGFVDSRKLSPKTLPYISRWAGRD